MSHIQGKHVVVVTNETVARLYLQPLKESLCHYEVGEIILPDGEQWKTIDTLNDVFDFLMAHRCDRQTTLIALGGGVIGDITGFAASCYRRGISFIQVPTTLLSQVDSSVGGKTGVNHPLGKNMIGAFYQPVAVIADITLLSSLPQREFSAGMAEIIKYGLIADAPFYQWILDNITSLMSRDTGMIEEAVYRSCKNKAAVVAEDEREHGRRAILNLGHTFAHAIETAQNYKGLLHGEAVAIGLMMAVDMSCRLGCLQEEDKSQLKGLLQKINLPVTMPAGISSEMFFDLMFQDKKVQDNKLRLVLLKKTGRAFVTSDFSLKFLEETIDAFLTDL